MSPKLIIFLHFAGAWDADQRVQRCWGARKVQRDQSYSYGEWNRWHLCRRQYIHKDRRGVGGAGDGLVGGRPGGAGDSLEEENN